MSEKQPTPPYPAPPEDQPPSRHTKYILVAALLVILIGGTAPWWVGQLGPANGHKSSTPADTARMTDTTATKPASNAAAEKPTGTGADAQSQSEQTLTEAELAEAGNAIINFTVEELSGLSLKLKVNYACNEEHGEKVMLAGELRGVESECTPVQVENPTKGTVMLSITAKNPGLSKRLDIYLYEAGKADEPFARRRFPFEQRFRDGAS